MTNEKDAAAEASATSDTTESRPATQARGNAPASDGRNVISYMNRDGQQVTIPVSNIQSVDSIVPSGTWDVPQRERDDLVGTPIVILDAINMTGQQNPFVVCLVVEQSDLNSGTSSLFSVALSGVPYNKVRRAMGFDEDGRMIGNNRLPMSGKLEKITPTSGGNWYWDFKDSAWTATAVR